jgi:MFS family permease
VAGLSLSTLLSSLGTSIANVGLPAMALAFDASFQEVQGIVLAYLLAVTTLMIPAGRLGDRLGRRRLLLAGIVLFTIASLLCGLAPARWPLLVARTAQGVGAALMMANTMALVGDVVPNARTGSGMGLLGTMSAIGTALGPSLGGALIAAFSWRAIFLVNVPLGVLTFLIGRHHLPINQDAPVESDAGLDLAGTTRLALRFAASLAMNAIVSLVMMTTLLVGPFYLSGTLGLEPAAVGLALSAGPLVAALTSVLAGRLVDRMGPPRMTIVGLGAVAAGAIILAMLPATFGVPGYITPIAVMTIGYALFQTANNTAVMTGIRPCERGVVSGMLNLSRNLGLVTGASAMGVVFAATGMRITFAVAALMIIFALAIALGSRGWAAFHVHVTWLLWLMHGRLRHRGRLQGDDVSRAR